MTDIKIYPNRPALEATVMSILLTHCTDVKMGDTFYTGLAQDMEKLFTDSLSSESDSPVSQQITSAFATSKSVMTTIDSVQDLVNNGSERLLENINNRLQHISRQKLARRNFFSDRHKELLQEMIDSIPSAIFASEEEKHQQSLLRKYAKKLAELCVSGLYHVHAELQPA